MGNKKKEEPAHKTVKVYATKAKAGKVQHLEMGVAHEMDPELAESLIKLGRAQNTKPAAK